MKKLIKIMSLILALGCLTLLFGCAPKGDPKEVIEKYYQNIKDGNIDGAYDTLCEATKKDFNKDDFQLWQTLNNEVNQLKEFKLEKISETKNKNLDGIEYKNVIEFNVTEKIQDFYNKKEDSQTYKRNVVNDNGVWKVYREKENPKELIAIKYDEIAWMYYEGKGKDKDLNQAASMSKSGIDAYKDYSPQYYTIGCIYSDLGRYDESIQNSNKYIEKSNDNESKSNGYNLLALCYKGKGEYTKAILDFKKALELNPNNEYAKTNLAQMDY